MTTESADQVSDAGVQCKNVLSTALNSVGTMRSNKQLEQYPCTHTKRSHAQMKLHTCWDKKGLFDPLFTPMYRLSMLHLLRNPQHKAGVLVSS